MSDATLTQPTFAYPRDFVNRVKAAFPYFVSLQKALDNNSLEVGELLKQEKVNVSPEEIIRLLDSGRLSELRLRADHCLKARAFRHEWNELTGQKPHG